MPQKTKTEQNAVQPETEQSNKIKI